MPSDSDFDLFHFEEGKRSFEHIAGTIGFRFWLASDLMNCIGYATIKHIKAAINRAIVACAHLGVPIHENFEETALGDWKLSRFACYLTVMNAYPRKEKVAKAQAYFIAMADAFRAYVHHAENVERINIRADLIDREVTLLGSVANRDLASYAFFQKAGYRGMYNLDIRQIRARKGLPDGRSPLDFMGKTELAANLFRLTQTEERIRNDDIKGQQQLELAAARVGRAVRKTMFETGGMGPENLCPTKDIREVRKNTKKASAEFAKLGAPSKDAKGKRTYLSGAVRKRGLYNYACFENAGYRGMYNQDIRHIRVLKGVPDGRSPLDFMGKTELAANLFRLTQTEARIRNDDIKGQQRLEQAAAKVGREVRKTMIEISGTEPENLCPAADIREVRKDLKKAREPSA